MPIRTCIGCRKAEAADLLVRLNLAPSGRLVIADTHPVGRGAWVHPLPGCIDQGLKAAVLSRALRTAVSVTSPDNAAAISKLRGRVNESGLEADGHPMSTQR